MQSRGSKSLRERKGPPRPKSHDRRGCTGETYNDLETCSKVVEDGVIARKHSTSYYCSIVTLAVYLVVSALQSILCRNDLARRPIMIGPMELFWQLALVLVIIVCILYAVIWANKDACFLSCDL